MVLIHVLRPKKVLLPIPSFYGYEYAAKAAGSEIMYYPLREEENFVLDEKLCGMLSEDIDLLFLANPNNPTGGGSGRRHCFPFWKIVKGRGFM